MDWDRLKTFYHVLQLVASLELWILFTLVNLLLLDKFNSEHSLKTKLFKRHTKGITLTEQGSYLFEETEKIFADLNSIEKDS